MIQEYFINPDLSVPVVGEQFFCSRRDPIREAASWYRIHQQQILAAQQILVFGLGAGFHLHFIPRDIKVFYFDIHLELSQRYAEKFPDSVARPLSQIEDYLNSEIVHFRPAQLGCETKYQTLSLKNQLNIKMICELLKAAPNDQPDLKIWRSLVEMVQ